MQSDQGRFGFDSPIDRVFNSEAGESAKEAGIESAANHPDRAEVLKLAREIARKLPVASTDRGITADDVVAELMNRGYGVHCLGNAAGSLFRGGDWKCIGTRKSIRKHAHGNVLRVWRLK